MVSFPKFSSTKKIISYFLSYIELSCHWMNNLLKILIMVIISNFCTFLQNILYYNIWCCINGHEYSRIHTCLVICVSESYTNITRQYFYYIIFILCFFKKLAQLPSMIIPRSLILNTPMAMRVFIPCITRLQLKLHGKLSCVAFISLVVLVCGQ